MDMVSISILMGRSIAVFGLMICSMDLELNSGLMAQALMARTNMDVSMEPVFLNGPIGALTTATGLMISSMEKVWNLGQMASSMKAIGSTTRQMVMVSTFT